MSSPNALRELTLARIRSFVREPEALFWTFGFPIMMAVGLGVAFARSPATRRSWGWSEEVWASATPRLSAQRVQQLLVQGLNRLTDPLRRSGLGPCW